MHWTLDQLLALPVEYYELLMEVAPQWGGWVEREPQDEQ